MLELLNEKCKQKSLSFSPIQNYMVGRIQEIEYGKIKTFYNDSEIIRNALQYFVEENYPEIINEIKNYIKE